MDIKKYESHPEFTGEPIFEVGEYLSRYDYAATLLETLIAYTCKAAPDTHDTKTFFRAMRKSLKDLEGLEKALQGKGRIKNQEKPDIYEVINSLKLRQQILSRKITMIEELVGSGKKKPKDIVKILELLDETKTDNKKLKVTFNQLKRKTQLLSKLTKIV